MIKRLTTIVIRIILISFILVILATITYWQQIQDVIKKFWSDPEVVEILEQFPGQHSKGE